MITLLVAASLQIAAPGVEEARVLAAAQALLDALERSDKAAMHASVVPGATMSVLDNGELKTIDMGAFIERQRVGGPKVVETLYEPRVGVDGDLAGLWAGYDVHVDGKLSHCGADIFTLVRQQGAWKVSALTWNKREDCPSR